MRRLLVQGQQIVNLIELPDDWTGATGEWELPEGMTLKREDEVTPDGAFVPGGVEPSVARPPTRIEELAAKTFLTPLDIQEALRLILGRMQ